MTTGAEFQSQVASLIQVFVVKVFTPRSINFPEETARVLTMSDSYT